MVIHLKQKLREEKGLLLFANENVLCLIHLLAYLLNAVNYVQLAEDF